MPDKAKDRISAVVAARKAKNEADARDAAQREAAELAHAGHLDARRAAFTNEVQPLIEKVKAQVNESLSEINCELSPTPIRVVHHVYGNMPACSYMLHGLPPETVRLAGKDVPAPAPSISFSLAAGGTVAINPRGCDPYNMPIDQLTEEKAMEAFERFITKQLAP
jgi:hypothetical protein